uniref:Proteasome assembly chaperone 4 n=1 Tax=Gasterosteus aculeatus aculeatus TaxID=481459 RepID=A0AAQ4S9F5_GASAC
MRTCTGMSDARNGEASAAITVHNFSERILEQVIHFHVMKLSGGFFLWVGSSPVLSNLAVSMGSRYDSMPLSTLVMGDPSNTAANSMAQRLAKKTKKQVFVSYSLPRTDSNLSLSVEQRIKKEDSMPLSTLVMGDPSNTAANSMAQRLAKKTKKQVFVSCSLPMTDSNLSLSVEQRIKKEVELHPEHF